MHRWELRPGARVALSIVTLTVSAVGEGGVTVRTRTRSVSVVESLVIKRAATVRVEDAALSNSCRWRHNWGGWGVIIIKNMMYEIGGKNVQGIERVQRRTCSKCNKQEERGL